MSNQYKKYAAPMCFRSFMNRHQGFTVIELLVTIAIISLLTTMAYPHYINIAQKVQRSDAQESLFFYQTKLTRCYLQSLDYESCLATIGLENGKRIDSLEHHYHIGAVLEYHNVILEAIPLSESGQSQDKNCQRFTLNQFSEMYADNANGEDNTQVCWGL